MSDDPGDKPFEPTEHKLQDARKRGEVPQVQDMPVVAASLGVGLALWALAPWLLQLGRRLLDDLLHIALRDPLAPSHLAGAVVQATAAVLLPTLPLLLLAGLLGTLVKFLLVGSVFSFKPVTPDLQRMNPAQGLKRLFSAPTWVQLAKSLLAAAAVLAVLAAWLVSQLQEVLALRDTPALLVLGTRLWLVCILIGLSVLTVIALFDVFYQRHAFRRQMRMDLKELQDEFKQLDGHPEQKAERRAEHRRTSSS